MITDRQLEDFHDEVLAPEDAQRISDALRRDPALRARLARIQRTDDLVGAALAGPRDAARPARRVRLALPLGVAAALVGAAVIVQRSTTPAAPAPMAVTPQTSTYEPVRVVFSLPMPSPAPAAPADATTMTPDIAEVDTDPWPLPEEISGHAIRTQLTAMSVADQLDACRAWATDARVRPFVFDHLQELGAQEGFAHDVAALGAELSSSPDLQLWVRSYLPPARPRPRSESSDTPPTRA